MNLEEYFEKLHRLAEAQKRTQDPEHKNEKDTESSNDTPS
jgi:hypothetical protein